MGPFLDSTQTQVETKIMGPLLVVLRDWAWFTTTKWTDFEPDGAHSTNPITYTCKQTRNICVEQQETIKG